MSERTMRIAKEQVEHDWAERGFSCDLWVDPPGTVWADFVHDHDELVLLLDGALMIEMNGRVLRLEPGNELLVPARVRHTVRNVGSGAARWLCGHLRAAHG